MSKKETLNRPLKLEDPSIDKAVKQAMMLSSRLTLENATYQARVDYNRVGFALQAILPILDRLVENTRTKFGLKKAVKDLIRESEDFIKKHHEAYEQHDPMVQDEKDIETRDIYMITARAYDWVIEMLYSDKPNEILSKKHLIDQYLEAGNSLEDVNVLYNPLNKKEN